MVWCVNFHTNSFFEIVGRVGRVHVQNVCLINSWSSLQEQFTCVWCGVSAKVTKKVCVCVYVCFLMYIQSPDELFADFDNNIVHVSVICMCPWVCTQISKNISHPTIVNWLNLFCGQYANGR